MKIFFLLFVFFLSWTNFFVHAETLSPEIGSYAEYQKNVDKYCKLDTSVPNREQLWKDWKDNSLVKQTQVVYADISKKEDGDTRYKDYLNKIKADPSRISLLNIKVGPVYLEKASYVYKETMGTVYACAVMNAKVRIIDNLLTKIPTTQSNLKKQLFDQLSRLRKKINTEECREVQDTSELSVKKTLLDNTTYQYCNYRQYLHYLETASKKSIDTYYKITQATGAVKENLLTNTDSAAFEIAQSANKITQEIAHTKEVYPQAMVAFTEFEKTYASHIILEFILQDYLELRGSLKKLLNPIGQVIYKASNAQSSGK